MGMRQLMGSPAKDYVLRIGFVLVLALCSGYEPVYAVTDAYTLPYAEDFEIPLLAGTAIGNIGPWQADASDGSTITLEGYSFSETRRPIVPSANTQVLRLQAGSNGVHNVFDVRDVDQVVYLDSMLKLAPRSGIPASVTNDPSVQLFFYLNADTNFVVYHGGLDGNMPGLTVFPVNPQASNDWNRFTITLDYVHGDTGTVDRNYFKVQLNGLDLTSAQAYSAPGQTGAYDGGAWFFTADQTGPDGIGSVGFEGKGGVDDLVVTTEAPLYDSGQVYYIDSVLTGSGLMLPEERVSIVAGASTQIVYQANSWNEISAFEKNSVPVPGAIGLQIYTAVFSNVQADITNRIVFSESVASIDGITPASWYGPLGANPALADEDGDDLSLYEEYLLNTDPTIANGFSLFQYGMDALGWESLELPYGRVIPEVSTNLVTGGWSPLGGYLTYDTSATVWYFPEDMPEEPYFLRIKVEE